MLEFINRYFIEHEKVLIIIGIISVIILITSILATPWLLGKVPVDYFTSNYRRKTESSFYIMIAKNLIGLIFLLVGIVMLIAPGQGVIFMLLGLSLMNFPGKRNLEIRIIQNDAMFQTVNWLRKKAKKQPLER